MAFTDNLGAQAAPISQFRSGIYGQPPQNTDSDTLSLVNQIKDRELRDFKDKADFMADLSVRQEMRMRNLYDPAKAEAHQMPDTLPAQMSPTGMSEYQRGELGIRQQQADVEKGRLAQQGKFGQEALDIKSQTEKLAQQKSDQINELKHQDLQRKVDEAAAKIKETQDKLAASQDNFKQQLELHKQMMDNMKAYHEADNARRTHEANMSHDAMQRKIDILEENSRQRGEQTVETEVDASGNKKKVTTKRGSAAETVDVVGKDGQQYTIPKNKLNDMDSDGTPHWKQVGGGEEQ